MIPCNTTGHINSAVQSLPQNTIWSAVQAMSCLGDALHGARSPLGYARAFRPHCPAPFCSRYRSQRQRTPAGLSSGTCTASPPDSPARPPRRRPHRNSNSGRHCRQQQSCPSANTAWRAASAHTATTHSHHSAPPNELSISHTWMISITFNSSHIP